MKNNGDYELSDVPRLMKEWRDSGESNPRGLLGARAALIDAAEELFNSATGEARGMNPAERRTFDDYAARVTEINRSLATYKAARIAMHGADMVHLPF